MTTDRELTPEHDRVLSERASEAVDACFGNTTNINREMVVELVYELMHENEALRERCESAEALLREAIVMMDLVKADPFGICKSHFKKYGGDKYFDETQSSWPGIYQK